MIKGERQNQKMKLFYLSKYFFFTEEESWAIH